MKKTIDMNKKHMCPKCGNHAKFNYRDDLKIKGLWECQSCLAHMTKAQILEHENRNHAEPVFQVIECNGCNETQFVMSTHRTEAAAERAAERYRKRFYQNNPGAYGVTWKVEKR